MRLFVSSAAVLSLAFAGPVLLSDPASAANHVICVLPAGGAACDETVATVQLALTAAGGNGQANTIQLGAATYSDGPYTLDGFSHALTLTGAGQSSTFLTLLPNPLPSTYVDATTATVSELTITMAGGVGSGGDVGLNLATSSAADHVTVDATTTSGSRAIDAGGSTISHSVVLAPADLGSSVTGIFSHGSNSVTDTTLTAAPGLNLSDPNALDVLSRVTIRSDGYAVETDGGNIDLDDVLIDLGTADNAVGIAARNANGSPTGKLINANHVTIVGGGPQSRGVWAYSASPNGLQTSIINLTNSIVRGPATSLVADASNDGAQGGPSIAQVNVSYTDYQTTAGTIAPVTGSGGVIGVTGNLVGVDPGFVSGSDRHLTAGSAVVDEGNPAAGGPATDRDGQPRVQDGDLNGVAVRDMGAYELGDTTPPDTTIDSGPSGPTGDSTPTFTFSSTEAGSTFVCEVDGGSETACTSPLTTSPLLDGPHTLSVTATDTADNSDPSPATRQWMVDTVPPDTTLSSGPTGLTGDSTPTFTFSSEAGATFRCKLDSGAEASCGSPFTAPALGDGPHTFTVVAVDTAGNRDLSPATRSFTVDATPPDTRITKQPARKSTMKKARLSFTSNEAGATFQCSVDGKAYAPCSSPLKLKVKVGKHTVLVRAVDAAGNVDPTPAKVRFKRLRSQA